MVYQFLSKALWGAVCPFPEGRLLICNKLKDQIHFQHFYPLLPLSSHFGTPIMSMLLCLILFQKYLKLFFLICFSVAALFGCFPSFYLPHHLCILPDHLVCRSSFLVCFYFSYCIFHFQLALYLPFWVLIKFSLCSLFLSVIHLALLLLF